MQFFSLITQLFSHCSYSSVSIDMENTIFSSSSQSKMLSGIKRHPAGLAPLPHKQLKNLNMLRGRNKSEERENYREQLWFGSTKLWGRCTNNTRAARLASADRWQHLKAKQNERKKYECKYTKERWCNKTLTLQRKMEVEEDGWTEGKINEKSGEKMLFYKKKNAGLRAAVCNRTFTEEDRDAER